MLRRPPISTRTDTLFPYTTLFRSQANAELDKRGHFASDLVSCRKGGDFIMARPEQIELMDVSPKQLVRSEEHTSELQSLMRISNAVFCLKKKSNSES